MANGAIPECFKNRLACFSYPEISRRLLTPGIAPLSVESNSTAETTWSTACPSVNDVNCAFNGFFSSPAGIS